MLKKAIELNSASVWIDFDSTSLRQIELRGAIDCEQPEIKLMSAHKVCQEIAEYLHGERIDFSKFPLATEHLSSFQQKTLQAMISVPYGETRSYGQIAVAIGSPGGARAIGNACGTNPFPIIVPCHRIIKANGLEGGFSAGNGWKSYLLRIESRLSRFVRNTHPPSTRKKGK